MANKNHLSSLAYLCSPIILIILAIRKSEKVILLSRYSPLRTNKNVKKHITFPFPSLNCFINNH